MAEQIMFHGGCRGCTQQTINGVDFCAGCKYFDANWELPDLNNKAPNRVDAVRAEVKARLGL